MAVPDGSLQALQVVHIDIEDPPALVTYGVVVIGGDMVVSIDAAEKWPFSNLPLLVKVAEVSIDRPLADLGWPFLTS